MPDDIVERLRRAVAYQDGYQMTMAPELVSAIADEIERLHEWKELCYEIRNSTWLFMRKKHLKQFDSMHNAETFYGRTKG
jgi:hypothetical protein